MLSLTTLLLETLEQSVCKMSPILIIMGNFIASHHIYMNLEEIKLIK